MSENLLQRFAQFIQLTNRNDTAVLAYLCRYFELYLCISLLSSSVLWGSEEFNLWC